MPSARVDTRSLAIEIDEESAIAAMLETPHETPRGITILAHGLGADRTAPYLRRVANRLHALRVATLSMDGPLHGDRRPEAGPTTFDEWVEAWRAFWQADGSRRIAAEFSAMLDACPNELSSLPVGYWGISLGTQVGVPWIASDPRPRAAVLGLFRGDGLLMRRFAPRVTVPVYFIQQLADELHPREVTSQLFDALGSNVKQLESSDGRHDEVPARVLDASATWLAEALTDPGG